MTRRESTDGGRAVLRASRRGQVVLVASAVVAVALASLVLVSLQLGAVEVEEAAGADAADLDRAVAYAERVVGNASRRVAGEYAWAEQTAAARRVDRTLETDLARLEAVGASDDTLYGVTQNGSAARQWARDDCPSGEDRVFGPCRVHGGVVMQERAGEAHVAAVALDLRVDGPDEATRLTLVVRGDGRRETE